MHEFIDLQVNGYAGIDFNQDGLTLDSIERACDQMASDGIKDCLATIITDDLDRMIKRLARIVELREKSKLVRRVIVGLHIEGPFINPSDGYRGAHPLDAVCPADIDKMKQLLDAAGGLTRIVTLAPEHDKGFHVTRLLAGQGITVSAGHCDPDTDTLRTAIDAGLSMFTHLGNGCPIQMHRHDNIIQRVLALADQLWLCFIADGVHVPFPALSNYIHQAGIDRCIVVTDAMAAAGLGPGRHRLGRWDLQVGEDLAAWAPDHSHLVGSAMSMPRCYQNLTDELGLSHEQARKLTYSNPLSLLEHSRVKLMPSP